MSRSNYNPGVFFPLILSGIFLLGFVIGNFYNRGDRSTGIPSNTNSSFDKLSDVMTYIDQEYVDSIERQELTDKLIAYLLQELDPHSYYMSAEEANLQNEPLEGGFDGIGVQFRIQNDTVVVVNPVVGGPSEKLGIRAGDRIVEVDGEKIAGIGVTNRMVMQKLKGPRGTKVQIAVRRTRVNDPIKFIITRDRIPITSIDANYMVSDGVGYIKVARFSRQTADEFREASEELRQKGMEKLILDLRGNGGGILYSAAVMADEFLEDGKLIVYTQGKSRNREDHYATSAGELEDIPLVVLIDEASASASEIIAGAIQDNDRGTIIGRRSFGKGLVQEQSNWPDGSATRLTIARYYTPTGRCIQKPYENGTKAYHDDYLNRLKSGELNSEDSIKVNDSLRFVTPGGKVVYGGGGIVPDSFIPIDTSGGSLYLSELFYTGQLYDFCFDYADQNRDELKAYASPEEFINGFQISDRLLNEFIEYAAQNGVEKDEVGLQRSRELIIMRLRAGIARNIFGDPAFYPIINANDLAIKEAVIALESQ